jgi:formylglycine-generating enzyme required for sulfatase activity
MQKINSMPLGFYLILLAAVMFTLACSNPAGSTGKTVDNGGVTVNGVTFNMIYVPPTPASGFQKDPSTTNISIIPNGYWIGETELTQELWTAVMGSNPSHFQGDTPNKKVVDGEIQEKRPVENVNWYEVLVFCNKLSILDRKTPVYKINDSTNPDDWGTVPTDYGSDTIWSTVTSIDGATGYRLPTGMEWMWAAMGATKGGDTVTTTGWAKSYAGSAEGAQRVNIGNYVWYFNGYDANGRTHEVGKKKANELGLYDMSGNVFEWCWDKSINNDRVSRSGSYGNPDDGFSMYFETPFVPYQSSQTLGFRVVRSE